ncbi:MAG TPA: hypothetical protein VME43_24350 [Bryobacteraceae bacterium]|nr:hypothetical protein [Bryobacteraceae bacterium]
MSSPTATNGGKTCRFPLSGAAATAPRLQIVSGRTSRQHAPGKPAVNLSSLFIQLVELQQRFGAQILTLEQGIQQQRRELVTTLGRLPEMTKKINWLIAGFYEQGRKEATLRERVGRQEAAMLEVSKSVRSLCETQARWKDIRDQLADVLAQARSIQTVAPLDPASSSVDANRPTPLS